MNNAVLQLTVRGVSPETKKALVKAASDDGVSVNRFLVSTIENAVGTGGHSQYIKSMRQFIRRNCITEEDAVVSEAALRWLKRADLEKQDRDKEDGVSSI